MKKYFTPLILLAINFMANSQISSSGLLAYYPFNGNLNAANNSAMNATGNVGNYSNRIDGAVSISNYSQNSEVCDRFGCFETTTYTDYLIELPIQTSSISNSITVAFWVNTQGFMLGSGWNTIFCKRLDRTSPKTLYNSINISTNVDGKLYAVLTASNVEYYLSVDFLNNEWKHVALVYDGNLATLYVDGTSVDTKSVSGNIEFNSSTPWLLGQLTKGNLSQGGRFEMDDLYIFNRALNPNEVNSLKTEGVTSLTPSTFQTRRLFHPNPAKEIVKVDTPSEIFNLLGEKVAQGEGNISISHLKPGVYMVKSGKETQKLIVE